jgi:protein TonB
LGLRVKTTPPESSRQPRRRSGVLAGWIAASVVAHALVLLAAPRPPERVPRVEILRVEIEQAEAPRETKPETPRVAKAKPRAKPTFAEKPRAPSPRPPREPAPREAIAPPLPPREILALPREPARPEPAFTVPAPEATATPTGEPARAPPPAPPPEAPAAPKPAPPPRLADARVLDSPVRYPRTAEQGRVTLKVLVSRDGRVAKATLEKTSGYANLDQHALQAVRGWRFAPARQGSEPVEQWLTVNVDY